VGLPQFGGHLPKSGYDGDALDEYRKAHFGDCITKCGSASESVLKILCTRRAWLYDAKKDTASTLLGIVLGKSSLDGFFSQPLMRIAIDPCAALRAE
jgi:hypothetical protein